IFNAFCDRAPILVLGATGPMDATRRRPWIDWIHTALVQGTQVRDYVKLDDQPASVAAIPEALLRAWRLARTEPQGPVYLCLDADLQEQALERPVPVPDVARFQPSAPPHADPRAIDEAARRLVEARFPLIVVESLGRRPEATPALCRLAERLAAPLVDLAGESEGRASVPSRHPLDMSGAREEVVAEADVVLALDVTNVLGALGQTDRATRAVRLFNETARVIAISLDDYAIRSWAHTFQSLAPVDRPSAAGAGLGYGLPAALGVTLAHRGTGKVCVNLQSDGDLLYVVGGLYTAAHHRLPLLTVTFNNRTYGNDEEHQEVVAKARGRPVENKVVGIRIDDPAPDFARIAQGFGVHAEGPIETAGAVGPALRRALRVVKDGRPALVDVITRP